MAHSFRKFISEVFVNGKFPKILPSENFPLYGIIDRISASRGKGLLAVHAFKSIVMVTRYSVVQKAK